MKLSCPENSCQNLNSLRKDGHYFRKSDSKFIQRYRCNQCGRKTSTAVLSACYGQNKRTINHMVEKLYVSKVSMRRIALILGVDKKTIARKVIFLGIEAKKYNQKFLASLKNSVQHLQFDDLITKEKTKLKPLSISGAVCANSRKILSLKVSTIPSFGLLAEKSRQKYGYRISTHKKNLDELFDEISNTVQPNAIIRSDEHKLYPEVVKKYFPNHVYQRFKGGRACVVGQGELKKLSCDPLFAINHTFAMLRDNISRLVRRSWCVTQSAEMLQHHLEIYMKYHNTKLV